MNTLFQLAPDRISAIAGLRELQRIYPLRRWNALDEEMRLDVQRIWKRNMGRDDRLQGCWVYKKLLFSQSEQSRCMF
nr:unnamed protein product [Digitaria exilis]